MDSWGRKIIDVRKGFFVDVKLEEETLSDGSSVFNVLVASKQGGVVRIGMTNELDAHELFRTLWVPLDDLNRIVGIEIDGDRIPEPSRDDCPRLSGQEIAIAEARDRDEEDRRKAEV